MYTDKLIIPKEEPKESFILHFLKIKKNDIRFATICAKELHKALYDDREGLKAQQLDFDKNEWDVFMEFETHLATIERILTNKLYNTK